MISAAPVKVGGDLLNGWRLRRERAGCASPGRRCIARCGLSRATGPAVERNSARFRVLIDGRAPITTHGSDVDEQRNGLVNGQRLYQLIRQPTPTADRDCEIDFLDSGVEIFSFTFG